jgi:hypothetical protein
MKKRSTGAWELISIFGLEYLAGSVVQGVIEVFVQPIK